jgi:hypothetical protein
MAVKVIVGRIFFQRFLRRAAIFLSFSTSIPLALESHEGVAMTTLTGIQADCGPEYWHIH